MANESAMQMTQMNTRITHQLKERGEAVFAQAGLTASAAIRRLFEIAVEHEREPEKIHELLFPDSTEQVEERRAALKRAHAQGSTLYLNACKDLGIDAFAPLPDLDELRFEGMIERYGSEGLQ